MRAFVRDYILCAISYKPLVKISPNLHFGAVGHKDDLIRFEIRRSKVKGQGQSETLCTFPAEAIPSSNTV